MASTRKIDFFVLYHSSQIHRYLMSGALALALSFGIVALYHGDIDTRGLMASVANIQRAPLYDADLIVTRHGQSLDVTLGANADGVDHVEFTLLSDPDKMKSITTSDPRVVVTAESALGAYRVSIVSDGKNIKAGTKLTTLTASITDNAPLAVTDVAFISGTDRYNLTSKVE